MDKNKKVLFKNTVMLYVLRFSTYFFSLVTVPYQTRVLGVEVYGKIGMATALMMYFQLFLDFGFILSATEDVAKVRDDKKALSVILSSVTCIKIFFSLISILALNVICFSSPMYKENYLLYTLYLIETIINSLLPDFLYRGMEDMSPITYRTVIVKAVFTILIFLFLKSSADYLVLPVIIGMGDLLAVLWSIYDIKKRYGITFCRISLQDLKTHLKRSSGFFLSRIATTIYTATNTIVLGFIDPVGISVGYYTAAYKLISTGQSALSPIADSVYPYMIKNRDFGLIKKVLKMCMPIIIFACIGAGIFADPLCELVFGKEFAGTGTVLRAMLPAAILTLPDYLFGFPCLSAIDKTQHANYSIYLSSGIHIINMLILWSCDKLNVNTLSLLISVAVGVEVLYRGSVIYFYKKKMKKESDTRDKGER